MISSNGNKLTDKSSEVITLPLHVQIYLYIL